MILEIPLLPEQANQLIVLLGNLKYTFYLKFNERSSVWTLDITETVSGRVLIQGMTLVLGQELLQPYNFGIGKLIVVDEREQGIEPGSSDFNTNSKLFWFSEDEVV